MNLRCAKSMSHDMASSQFIQMRRKKARVAHAKPFSLNITMCMCDVCVSGIEPRLCRVWNEIVALAPLPLLLLWCVCVCVCIAYNRIFSLCLSLVDCFVRHFCSYSIQSMSSICPWRFVRIRIFFISICFFFELEREKGEEEKKKQNFQFKKWVKDQNNRD